jgi:hypothetical protein
MDIDMENLPEEPDNHGEEMTEDEIDENIEGTFPASDPPSWTLGTNHRSSPDQPIDDDLRDKK